MKNHSFLYIIMLAVTGLGLWAVMKAGSRLQAAAHLEGDWTFEAEQIGPTADGPEHLGKGFHLDQSGQFVRVRFGDGQQMSLRARKMPQGYVGKSPMPIELSDGTWELKGQVWSEAGQLRGTFSLNGPQKARFTATRISAEHSEAAQQNPSPRQAQTAPPPSTPASVATTPKPSPIVAISETPLATTMPAISKRTVGK